MTDSWKLCDCRDCDCQYVQNDCECNSSTHYQRGNEIHWLKEGE
jgi:hypothetical protein